MVSTVDIKYLTVSFVLEKSDHDGYCSGGDCEYSNTKCEIIIPSPKNKEYYLGNVTNAKEIEYWSELISLELYKSGLDVNYEGSGYCGLSQQCEDANLERHDYRISDIVIQELV